MALENSNDRAQLDVIGLGNAIVDVIAYADDPQLDQLELVKSAMTLVDEERSAFLYSNMNPAREISGGSCANTMAAMADLGSKAAYIGRIKDDELGRVFAHDIKATGVDFINAPAAAGPSTARSLIFVTPDAQRTMQTYLGACVELAPDDVDEARVAAAKITYLEGYLWDRPEAKAACLKAAGIAHKNGNQLALTLSDSFCVDRWRGEFLDLIDKHVDILFANEAEILSLYETEDLTTAVDRIAGQVAIAAITRSEHGSIITHGSGRHTIPATKPDRLLDTTGAGDLYAAGVLHGIAQGWDLPAAGLLGSKCATSIIAQYGARSEQPLAKLIN